MIDRKCLNQWMSRKLLLISWAGHDNVWHAAHVKMMLVACQRRDNEWQSANEGNYGITVNTGLVPVHRVHVSVHSEVTSWPADWSVSAVLASHWSAVVCDRCRSNSWHLSWSAVRSWPSSSSLHQSYQISMKLELGNTDHHPDKQWLVKFYHWRQGEEDRMRGGERKWVDIGRIVRANCNITPGPRQSSRLYTLERVTMYTAAMSLLQSLCEQCLVGKPF